MIEKDNEIDEFPGPRQLLFHTDCFLLSPREAPSMGEHGVVGITMYTRPTASNEQATTQSTSRGERPLRAFCPFSGGRDLLGQG